MLAAAGLSFAACQKNVDTNKIEGPVALTISIANPEVKAPVAPTDGKTIDLKKVEIYLHAASGDNVNKWYSVIDSVKNSGGTFTFYNVVDPTKVEVRINDGKAQYTGTIVDEKLNVTPAEMQAYGSAEWSSAEFKGTVEHDGTIYDRYAISVNATIPVGRIELSGIKHDSGHLVENCEYSALQFEGIYIDKANTISNTSADVTFETATDGLNKEVVDANFIERDDLVFPANPNVYAFNFFPGESLPEIKFVFTGTTKDNMLNDARRYAVVKKWKSGESYITKFEAGKVYSIKNITIADDDFTGDESGNTTVAVEVTVDVQDWTIVDTTVEF